MYKYLTVILLFTLIQGNAKANPLEGFEDYLISFIENQILGLNKYKQEIEDKLSIILKHKDEHALIQKNLELVKNQMEFASDNGDTCAKNVLQMLDAKKPEDCPTVDDLIQAANKIITSTTDIVAGTIHSFYIIFANNQTCGDLHGFKCFLKIFHQAKDTFFDVMDKLISYSKNAGKLVEVYTKYFKECKNAKIQHIDQHMYLYGMCSHFDKSVKYDRNV